MALNFLIKRLSFLSVSIEKAMAIEIDKGRPSGTATIIIAIEMVKKSRILTAVSFDNTA